MRGEREGSEIQMENVIGAGRRADMGYETVKPLMVCDGVYLQTRRLLVEANARGGI